MIRGVVKSIAGMASWVRIGCIRGASTTKGCGRMTVSVYLTEFSVYWTCPVLFPYTICLKGNDAGTVYGEIAWDITVDKNGVSYMPEPWLQYPNIKDLNSAANAWNNEKVPEDEPPHNPLPPFRQK
jgi:hypothetical protein